MKHSTLTAGMAPTADQRSSSTGDTIDVSEFAKPFFDVPVQFSRDVWALCVAMSHADAFRQTFRIRSILVQSKIAIRNAVPHVSEISFEVRLRMLDSIIGYECHRIRVKAVEIDRSPALLLQLDEPPRLEEVAS